MNPTDADVDRLVAVLEQAERERDAAQAAWRQSVDLLQQARTQAEQLAQYQRDYDERWGARAGMSGAIGTVMQAHTFSQRLAQAIAQQALACQRCERQCEHAREVLVQREQRLAAVRKLIDRRVQAALRLDERRSQRQTDEVAMRRRSLAASTNFGQ